MSPIEIKECEGKLCDSGCCGDCYHYVPSPYRDETNDYGHCGVTDSVKTPTDWCDCDCFGYR